MAIDPGSKRMGLAISDPLGITAQGLPTMARRNKKQDLNFLKSLVRKHGVSLIVLGNPLRMDGSEGVQSEKAQDFARQLEQHLRDQNPGVKVRLWDERLTSVEATRVLRQSGAGTAERGKAVDQMAAVLLLENFRDSQRQSRLSPSPDSRPDSEPDSERKSERKPESEA